jgi:hypothetical protein
MPVEALLLLTPEQSKSQPFYETALLLVVEHTRHPGRSNGPRHDNNGLSDTLATCCGVDGNDLTVSTHRSDKLWGINLSSTRGGVLDLFSLRRTTGN